MPKPTFMQSVMRKPTRSYADPYAASPWADAHAEYERPAPVSRYSARADEGVHLGYTERDGPEEAGPSRRRQVSMNSTASDTGFGTRFPKPAKKVQSSITLRETANGEVRMEEPVRSGTIKKKKKRPAALRSDAGSVASEPGLSPLLTPTPRRPQLHPSHSSHSSHSSTRKVAVEEELVRPPPLMSRSQGGSSSSNDSSRIPPLSPENQARIDPLPSPSRPALSVVQKSLGTVIAPPLTPPESDRSVTPFREPFKPLSTMPHIPQHSVPPPKPPKSLKRLSISSVGGSESDEDVFYTPAQSPNLAAQDFSQLTVRPNSLGPPTLMFQPPTPDPIPDPLTSPFHSEPSSSSSSLRPDGPRTPRPIENPTIVVKSPTPSPGPSRDLPWQQDQVEEDVSSNAGDNGSDGEDESPDLSARSSRQSSFVSPRPQRPPSRTGSRTPSVARSAASEPFRPPSRQSSSRNTSGNSFDDFVVHRRGSVPFSDTTQPVPSRGPSRAGSIRSSVSGYGKGGWAAAAASSTGRASPIQMYMPAGANHGWAEFQQPQRQSRFTPLPRASQPADFNRLVHGTNGQESSAPSSYSQDSDEEDGQLPVPSRSYARQDYQSEGGNSDSPSQTSIARFDSRQPSVRSFIDPYAEHHDSYRDEPTPQSAYTPRLGGSESGRQSRASRPQSPVFDSRPTSPVPGASRPSSRMGFDPPSFLNPDTLTLLPEMTVEDSERTYVPSEPSRPRRPASSVFGGRSKTSRSEVGGREEDDDLGDLPSRRSKSALGHRNGDHLSQWGGSSAGEGVLMESNGKGPESVSGYSNLVLPAGAYRPSNPVKTAAELDSRIMGMPHSTMAAIILSTVPRKDTPTHLRNLNPPVDFASHLRPPHKVGNSQLLVQVYATAVDNLDIRMLDDKGRGDVGKWVPGRSFVGRCLRAGAEEKEIVRGDIVIGILDVRKSGALAEYVLCDRRRLARAPHPTNLTLEQLCLLPLYGISAARAIRTHTKRHSRAVIMDAHRGVPALVCQELSRAGVNVTAIIGGGEDHYEAQNACMLNGARGVLTGSAAAVMLGLDEGGWDFVLDSQGGQRIYDAAKRLLKHGAKLITLVEPDKASSPVEPVHARSSGMKSLKAAFGSRRKDVKSIVFEYLPPSGSGEPGVDSSGVDCRDVLEEGCMSTFRPEMIHALPLERGADAFKRQDAKSGVAIVRLIN